MSEWQNYSYRCSHEWVRPKFARKEIPGLTIYNKQDLDNQFDVIDEDKEMDIVNDQAREQSTADVNEQNQESAADEDDNNQPSDEPLPRLRRNRTRTYGHLKGRDGDGSLPTTTRPHEFRHL